MEQIEEINAINYNNEIIKEVKERVVKDKTIKLIINNKITRNLSAIQDSLKEFTVGYLFNENLINSIEDIINIEIKDTTIRANINDKFFKINETVLCSDSSGGQRTKIKNVEKVESNLQINAKELISRIEELKQNAKIWQATGGTHVAGIVHKNQFIVKEDVSRHVAVDKVIGYGLLHDFDLSKSYVIYSGRMPADMVIKMTRVGIPLLVSNAAPTSSGYNMAKKGKITLVGFIRGQRFNVYNNLNRVMFED